MTRKLVLLVALAAVLAGCTAPQESGPEGDGNGTAGPGDGGAPPQDGGEPPQDGAGGTTVWEGLVLPPGVEGEVVLDGLNFPTSVAWDGNGTMYVGEVGFTEAGPRVLRVDGNGTTPLDLAGANLTEQLLDVTVANGTLWFSTTSIVHALDLATGEVREVLAGLPAWGDHRTDEILVGDDGRVYVSQGTVTNSGIVGLDQAGVPNAVNGVILERPDYREVPCVDVVVSGWNYETTNVLEQENVSIEAYEGAAEDVELVFYGNATDVPENATDEERAVTGPFVPFGTPTYRGETIRGDVRCNGSVLSFEPDGSDLRVVAWGFRNPFGMKFGPDGMLWVTNNGFDNRGSRPVGATPDDIWRIDPSAEALWTGWPDHSAGLPLTDPFFSPLFGPEVKPLLLELPNEVPDPVTWSSAHASTNKFDFGPDGDIYVAEFGTLNIEFVAGALTGMNVARVDVDTGRVTEFIVHEERYSGEFRPVEAAFGPDGRLYVVDFGAWRIQRPNDTASQGEALVNTFQPGTGRVLAFTLPSSMTWEGFPVGNVGGDGRRTWNGTVGNSTGNESGAIEAFEYGFGGPQEGRVGEPVVFVNRGEEGHTATDVNGTFNSGFAFAPGATFTWTPSAPGTYTYYCELHPAMRGRITVAG